LGPGIENAVIAIAITSWPAYARIARAETLDDPPDRLHCRRAIDRRLTVAHRAAPRDAACVCPLSLCASRWTWPASSSPPLALGFLGLGAQPPSPEWGAMIANGRQYVLDQWWVAAAPGAAIFLISLAFNLLGDGLRDALDPKGVK
jgi:peptide/nickel transport system permease protein